MILIHFPGLADENDRVLHYLEPSTKKPLIASVETQLIESHVPAIIAKGFSHLMDNSKNEDLRRMYALFSRVNTLDQLKIAFNKYIKDKGATIVNDQEKDATMVQELLDFKAKLDSLLEQAFSKNENFTYTLKEAFEHFVNVRANKPAELIAKFIDTKLKTGNKGITNLMVMLQTLTFYSFLQLLRRRQNIYWIRL